MVHTNIQQLSSDEGMIKSPEFNLF